MITAQFLLTAFVVVLAPGTGVVYTLAVALGQGRRAGLWAALGCTIGIIPALLAATFGLAALLHSSALLFQIVKFAGVAYLLYLAAQMLGDGGALRVENTRAAEPGATIARRGAVLNILNPKLSIFFLALLPPFLSGDPTTATPELLTLGAIFMAMTFAVFVVYALAAAQARDLILSSARAMTWVNRVFAATFGALALRLGLERA